MIDVVIPFRNSEATNNAEIKYTFRSIFTRLSDVRRVLIIGDHPGDQYQNYDWIPFKEYDWFHELTANIHRKLELACKQALVSDPFLYMNDDHFLLHLFEAPNFPYLHKGPNWPGHGVYKNTMAQTRGLFGENIMNYDTHAPMLIHKERYLNGVATLNWKKWFGYCVKTSYMQMTEGLRDQGKYYPDLKIDTPLTAEQIKQIINGRSMFSVGDRAMNVHMIDMLEQLYPEKSIFEV